MGTPKTQAQELGSYRQDGGKCPDRRRRVAGAGGFEPPHGGIKIHCLTAWRRPIMPSSGRTIVGTARACNGELAILVKSSPESGSNPFKCKEYQAFSVRWTGRTKQKKHVRLTVCPAGQRCKPLILSCRLAAPPSCRASCMRL